jgi:hypothetical protein
MMMAVAHTPPLSTLPLTRFPMILEFLEIMMMRIRRGGARKPFITAVQKRAWTGLSPTKLTSVPRRVEAAIRP